MVYIKENGIMRAGKLRFKYIGPHTIDVNFKDLFLTVIDTDALKSETGLQNDLVLMEKIVNIAKDNNEDIDRDEIDKFIQGGYLYE